MARLTASTRAKIPSSQFALPGRRFPVHDKSHAAVAKSYASRMVKRGQLSPASKATIFAKANRRLAMQVGGMAPIKLPMLEEQRQKAMQNRKYWSGKPSSGYKGPIRPNPFNEPLPFSKGGKAMSGDRKRYALGGVAKGKRLFGTAVKSAAKIAPMRKGYQMGGTAVGDSGRSKAPKRFRMKYQNGGVAAASYDGEKGQARLRGNPNKNNFADFDGSGG